jgi:hypothetical protein
LLSPVLIMRFLWIDLDLIDIHRDVYTNRKRQIF